jgi:hypothetical protein
MSTLVSLNSLLPTFYLLVVHYSKKLSQVGPTLKFPPRFVKHGSLNSLPLDNRPARKSYSLRPVGIAMESLPQETKDRERWRPFCSTLPIEIFWRWKRGDSYTPPKCQFCCNWPSGETRIDSARDVECWWWRTRLYGLTKSCEQKRKVLLIVSNCVAEEAETCCIGSAHRKSAIKYVTGLCRKFG